MILQINKYHRTAQGETTSSVKVERENAVECHRVAQKQFADFWSAYAFDASVLDFTIAIIDPKTLVIHAQKIYVSPVAEAEEATE